MTTARRRFYKTVSVSASDDGFEVKLDGRPIRTPMKRPLALPTHALAEAVAAEWDAQEDRIHPHAMTLTKLAYTAIDRIALNPELVSDAIVSFAASDLVCYRAAWPLGLVARQAEAWDPMLDWARTALHASFEVTTGVVHVAQPPSVLKAVRRYLESLSYWELTAILSIATLLDSALMALRVFDGNMRPLEAWAAAHVDEDWQIEHWGEDAEAVERRAGRRAEFDACCRFSELSRR